MKRKLVFEGEHQARNFEYLYQGFVMGRIAPKDGVHDFDVTRKEAKLMREFRAVGIPEVTKTWQGQPLLTLTRSAVLTIDAELHVFLRDRMQNCSWRPEFSVEAVDVVDWLEAAEQIEE